MYPKRLGCGEEGGVSIRVGVSMKRGVSKNREHKKKECKNGLDNKKWIGSEVSNGLRVKHNGSVKELMCLYIYECVRMQVSKNGT